MNNRGRFLLHLVVILNYFSSDVLASDLDWKLAGKLGGVFSEISKPTENGKVLKVQYGGLPIGLGLVTNLTEKVIFDVWGNIVVDFGNEIISKQNFETGLYYTIIGSHYETRYEGKEITVTHKNQQQLLFGFAFGMHYYDAITKSGETQLSGSTFEIHSGFRYRYNQFAFALMSTITSISSSSEKITSQSSEFGIIWMQD